MKALLVESLSTDLSGVRLAEIPSPINSSGQVLVRVRATSLNFPDLLMTRGEYQLKPPLPFVLGLELAGDVVSADTGGVFRVGQRVFGGIKTGAMAELAAVPASALRVIPDALDYAAAAALGAAYGTAYTGLVEQGRLREGQWVLVHGATGGVGLAAVDLACALGAKVIATTGSPDKLDALRAACRAEAVILASGQFRAAVAELTGGRLADLVFDPVGGDVFDESTRCVAFGGQLQVVGFASGRIGQIAANIPLIKGFSVVGVRAGEFARQFPERGAAIRDAVLRLAASGGISPRVDRVVPLAQWREAFALMAERKILGKIVLEP